MRILVSGATGFLGRGLCRRLLDSGAEVRALVRDGSAAGFLEEMGVAIVRGDLRDTWSLDGAAQGVDTVLHAGAVHRGGRLTRDDFWQVNSEGTRRLLQEALNGGARRFVYISTAGVHGDVGRGRASETAPFTPADLYQTTKLRGEQAVRRVSHSDGLDCVILRPSTIYGPGDQRFLKLFRPIAQKRFVLIGSGQVQTHFIYRDDAVEAIVMACQDPKAAGETFLLAGPRPAHMSELIDSVSRAVDVAPPRARVPYAPVWALAHATQAVYRVLRRDPPLYPRRLAFFGTNRAYQIDKAREILGFTPAVELGDGLERTASWYREEGLL